MSGEVLFLAHRMPFPPDRGDKIRSSHILRRIAELRPVHVATFAETAQDLAEEPQLAQLAASHCLVRRTKPLPFAGVEALLQRTPVSLTAFHSARLQAYVTQVLRERPIETIYVFSGQMGQYVPGDFAGRLIVDFVDVDSAKFDAYGAEGSGPRAWLDAREGRLLRMEEARLAKRAQHSLLVSDEEARLFADRLPSASRRAERVMALRNGIDSTSFDPDTIQPQPDLAQLPAPRLIFTGQMDYPPNIAAAERAITRLMPRIRAALPQASFHVVGRNPPDSLKAHSGEGGCHIWGEVADIRTWLAGADLALVPLEIARGVQNKVLEAMAMRLPVVLSPQAATGIGATNGEHLIEGDSDELLVQAVIDLVHDRAAGLALGQRARSYVREALGWTATLAPLEGLLSGNATENTRHAA